MQKITTKRGNSTDFLLTKEMTKQEIGLYKVYADQRVKKKHVVIEDPFGMEATKEYFNDSTKNTAYSLAYAIRKPLCYGIKKVLKTIQIVGLSSIGKARLDNLKRRKRKQS